MPNERQLNFSSDNVAGIADEVKAALINELKCPCHVTYGEDEAAFTIEQEMKRIFATDLRAFVVSTGTAANALGLATLVKPYNLIVCHHESHIQLDECGAVEAMTGGAKLVSLPGKQGLLVPELVIREFERFRPRHVHHAQNGALSLTQASESGTLYQAAEVEALGDIARTYQAALHMDGARFANAVAALGCHPADLTWKAGVDVLTFGATKNGCLAGEIVVLFRPELADDFLYRRKRSGHLLSKQWGLSTQIAAYLQEDRWLTYASKANAQAGKLAHGLRERSIGLIWPQEINACFALFAKADFDHLRQRGLCAYSWPDYALGADSPFGEDYVIVRLYCSFATSDEEIMSLLSLVESLQSEGLCQPTAALVSDFWQKG